MNRRDAETQRRKEEKGEEGRRAGERRGEEERGEI